jgi:hypothetical protein
LHIPCRYHISPCKVKCRKSFKNYGLYHTLKKLEMQRDSFYQNMDDLKLFDELTKRISRHGTREVRDLP